MKENESMCALRAKCHRVKISEPVWLSAEQVLHRITFGALFAIQKNETEIN